MAYKPAGGVQSPDATIPEVMAFRKESANTVFRKIHARVYEAHKNLDNTLITWKSVYADRDACLKRGRLTRPATTKRKPGRPPKIEDHSGVPETPKRDAAPSKGRRR